MIQGPRRKFAGRTVDVTVKLPEALGVQVKAYAQAHDVFVSDVIRQAVARWLEERMTV